MIQRETWLNVADNSGVKWLNVFHIYGGFKHRTAYLSTHIKGSAKVVNPPRVEYKGFKLKPILKGTVLKAIFLKSNYVCLKHSNFKTKVSFNSAILLKKKNTTWSKYSLGVIFREVNRKKYLYLFKKII